jgi:hypothetical protein
MKTRKECYEYIKTRKGLQDEIKRDFGWCYTNVSTDYLNEYVERDYNSLFNKIRRFFGGK